MSEHLTKDRLAQDGSTAARPTASRPNNGGDLHASPQAERTGADDVESGSVEDLFAKTSSASGLPERDWGEAAERDFADIIGLRFMPVWANGILCAGLGATMHLVDPVGLGVLGSVPFACVLFAWGLVLRRLSRPSVVLFWAATIVAIIAFCAGLVVALDRVDPLAAVLWSIGGATVGWLTVMSCPSTPQRP